MADQFYNTFIEKVTTVEVDLELYDINILLLTDSYPTNDMGTHVYLDDIQAWEVSGTGYTAGGQILVDMPSGLVKNAGDKTYDIVAPADPQWANATLSARYAALYMNSGAPSTSVLIALYDLGEVISVVGETISVSLPADGVILDVNYGANDVGYQLHLGRAMTGYYDTPFNVGQNKTIDLLDSTYVPDYENHSDDADTFSFLSNTFAFDAQGALETDCVVYRLPGDSYSFTNFSGTFRYVSVRRTLSGQLGICLDLGSDVSYPVAQTVIFDFPDGYMKLKLEVETP